MVATLSGLGARVKWAWWQRSRRQRFEWPRGIWPQWGIRYQPNSPLTIWFHERVGTAKGRIRRIAIVAMARKLLIALWRYLETGVVPTGAKLKTSNR
jgi:hypothetical protein